MTHHADPGPAAWREYTGDPSPFYREGVGPVFDHGVYRLHLLTVAARARSARSRRWAPSPRRPGSCAAVRSTGQTIAVTTPDHVLINLAFRDGALGQLLASFGTPATMAPWLEVHFPMATLSFSGQSYEPDAPVSVYVDDDTPAATEGWHDAEPPDDDGSVVEAGVRHFIAVLRGEERPVLTARAGSPRPRGDAAWRTAPSRTGPPTRPRPRSRRPCAGADATDR